MASIRHLRIATLPLAVYREVAAHLEQVSGASVELLWDNETEFDYLRSQIQGLKLHLDQLEPNGEQRIEQILTHYGDRFGQWETQHQI